ncbi:Maltase alpha-glucosidase Mal1 [Schizosaccharomyces pombe]
MNYIEKKWWKEASIYQIYVSSFKDSNGDGFGDLKGLLSKLDYIEQLGVDAVWLTPIFASPLHDMGYDVSDYCAIHPRYGDIHDIEQLSRELHDRGIKLLLDLVVNHTSNEHPWFIESRSSKTNPKRDWYIWRPPVYDENGNRHPPTNWAAFFSPSAWEWDEETQEYYLHIFLPEQPDLNWENKDLRNAVADIIHFWMKLGVDGFRMDAIDLISKGTIEDAPIRYPSHEFQPAQEYFTNGPKLHEYLRLLGSTINDSNGFSIGELACIKNTDDYLKIVGSNRKELDTAYNFTLVNIDHSSDDKFGREKWNLTDLKALINDWQTKIFEGGGWYSSYLENHDQPRSISRFLPYSSDLRTEAAKLLATMLIFQGGTPFIFQGQELGLANIPLDWPIEEYKDKVSLDYWEEQVKCSPSESERVKILHKINYFARDNGRLPMQWNSSDNAGFTEKDVEPWMRVNDDYKEWNAELQAQSKDTVLSFYKTALKLRKEHQKSLIYGRFTLLSPEDEQIFSFTRTSLDEQAQSIVIMNFTNKTVEYVAPLDLSGYEFLLGNYPEFDNTSQALRLRPFESILLTRTN